MISPVKVSIINNNMINRKQPNQTMETVSLYNEIWDDLEEAMLPQNQIFIDFLCQHAEALGLTTAEILLTIGPGKGSTEFALMDQCLPSLKTLIGVEPSSHINETQTKLSAFPTVFKKFEKSTFQDYKGPDTPVDVILFCHSIYHIMDDLERHIRRAMEWLSPGGIVIIEMATAEHGSYFDHLRQVFSEKGVNAGCSESRVETCLKNIDISYKKYRIPEPLHLSKDSAKRLFFELMIERKATEEEHAINDEVLRPLINAETGVVEEETSVFILENKAI